jgi:hypothetical protein
MPWASENLLHSACASTGVAKVFITISKCGSTFINSGSDNFLLKNLTDAWFKEFPLLSDVLEEMLELNLKLQRRILAQKAGGMNPGTLDQMRTFLCLSPSPTLMHLKP